MTRLVRSPLLVSLLVLAVVGSGCASQSCTLVGALSGASVTISGADSAAALDVTICHLDACSTVPAGGARGPAFVGIPELSSTAPVELRVTVRSKGEVLVPETRLTSTPEVYEPNGHGCDPTTYIARATVEVPSG